MKRMILMLLVSVCTCLLSYAQEMKECGLDDTPKFVPAGKPCGEPQRSKPSKEDVIYGDSEFRLWVFDSPKGGPTFGIWESTPGKWKYTSPQWEYCRILSGKTIITEDGGESITVKAGDSFLLKAGVRCTWEVLETTRKEFVAYSF